MPSTLTNQNDATSDVFDALSNPLRRLVLTQLIDSNPRDVTEFTESNGGLGADTLAVSIRHQHLPHLEETGFIEWDRDVNVVTRGPRFEEVAPPIDLLADHREDWS